MLSENNTVMVSNMTNVIVLSMLGRRLFAAPARLLSGLVTAPPETLDSLQLILLLSVLYQALGWLLSLHFH